MSASPDDPGLRTGTGELDASLRDFLKARGLTPFERVLAAQDILTLDLLKVAIVDTTFNFKEALCQAYAPELAVQPREGETPPNPPLGKQILVTRFKSLTVEEVDTALQAHEKPKPVAVAPHEDLMAFLKSEGISESLAPVFVHHGAVSKASLRALLADDTRRGALVQDLRDGVPLDGQQFPKDPAAADRMEALKTGQLDVVKPKANEDLKKYLEDRGIPASHTPVFEKHGITSLQGLDHALSDPKRKDALVNALNNGTTDGATHYTGVPVVAEHLNRMPSSDVRNALHRSETPAAMSKDFDERQAKLRKAIDEVEKLRKEAADDAKNNASAALSKASNDLKAILRRCDADALLKKLTPADFATTAALDAALKDAGAQLADKLSADQLKVVDALQNLEPPDKLAAHNGLFRGMLLRATELSDVSGSDLLLPRCNFVAVHAKQERTQTFGSQEATQFASKTVDRSSSTFATSNRASGAAFIGSGIGAISMAGAHARARMEFRAVEKAVASSYACRTRMHRIDVTRGILTIPMDQVRLTPEALTVLHRLAGIADAAAQERWALTFLLTFGSHVFARFILGGRYDYVATAVATTQEELGKIDTALTQTSNWQVSTSAGYANLSGIGSVTTANEGSKSSGNASSDASKVQSRTEDMRTNTEVYGGLDQLSLEYWKRSLEKNPLWHVLDRQDPVAIWSLLAVLSNRDLEVGHANLLAPNAAPATDNDAVKTTTLPVADSPPVLPADVTPAQVRGLAPLLEKVWVRQVLVPSMGELDSTLWDLEQLTKAESIQDIEKALKAAAAVPLMTVKCFKKDFPEARHFKGQLDLPKGYKILSGGVLALDQDKGNFIVASYPAIDARGNWSWHARAKEIETQASERHSIRVIALYDPDDVWDVRIFSVAKERKEKEQILTIGQGTGYTITGGGGKVHIPEHGNATLTSCGFVTKENPSDGSVQVVDGIYVSSREWRSQQHTTTAFAIGLRAKNGARLQLRAIRLTTAKATHIEEVLEVGPGVIGGGVYSKVNTGNFLTGSCPVMQDDGKAVGWHGTAKDHHDAQPNELDLVALVPVNTKVIYEPLRG